MVGLVGVFAATACGSASNGSTADGGSSGGDSGTELSDGGDDSGSPGGDSGVSPTDSGHPGTDGGDSGTITSGLHVVMGTGGSPGHIVDGSGNTVQLHGADRSGTEFACVNGGGFFDGPSDQTGIDAMKAWNINAVRVPLNADCWLGINGVASAYAGANYQNAIAGWVNLLTQNGMVVILDLHWTAPGTTLANSQIPMADADHSPTFWSQVATAYKGNGQVIFDLFNEPFISDWGCWTSGGMCAQDNGTTYAVAGMASLLKAVRDAGAQNVVILGGLGYSSDMSQWVTSVNGIPSLPAPLNGISIANVAASWHAYDFNSEQSMCPSQYNNYMGTCASAQATAMATSATSVLSAGFPVVIGETGISAFSASSAMPFTTMQITDLETWFDNLLDWAEMQGQGYLAWSWDTDTDPVLITDYTGTPTPDFGETYKAHLSKF
jgi:endoglucanase